jgi:hypothetical protein
LVVILYTMARPKARAFSQRLSVALSMVIRTLSGTS